MHPETKGSLVQFVIQNSNQAKLLDQLLHADCQIGLPMDRNQSNPLSIAIEHGKWRFLQLQLEFKLEQHAMEGLTSPHDRSVR